MTTTSEAVARNVAHVVLTAAKEKKLSQRDLSDRTGIPLVTLHRKLHGRSSFTLVELAVISTEIGLSLPQIAHRAEALAAQELKTAA